MQSQKITDLIQNACEQYRSLLDRSARRRIGLVAQYRVAAREPNEGHCQTKGMHLSVR